IGIAGAARASGAGQRTCQSASLPWGRKGGRSNRRSAPRGVAGTASFMRLSAASPRGRGLAHRRASHVRREEIHLTNLLAERNLRSLAATIKERWICEQAHQQLKEDLGLDHFEGRSWHGLNRHALMT